MNGIRPHAALTALLAATGLPLAPATAFGQDVPATVPATAPAADATTNADTPEALVEAVVALSKDLPGLPPERAASRWLALYDRILAFEAAVNERARTGAEVPDGATGHGAPLSQLLDALPPPAAWDELARQVDRPRQPKDAAVGDDERAARLSDWGATDPAVREAGLRLLAHVLRNDPDAQRRDLDALKQYLSRDADHAFTPAGSHIDRLTRLLTGKPADPDGEVKRFEQELAQARRGDATQLDVPDLVALVGAERAEALLRRAVLIRGTLQVDEPYPGEPATKRLAQRLALELLPQTKRPHWELVDVRGGAASAALYEAMDRRFPYAPAKRGGALLDKLFGRDQPEWAVAEERGLRAEARAAYVVHLILAGRAEDASRVAGEIDAAPREHDADGDGVPDAAGDGDAFELAYDAVEAIAEAPDPARAYAALHRLLSDHPQWRLWPTLRTTAARAGKTAEALALLRDAAGRAGLAPAVRRSIRRQLADALLADDRVDEAVDVLRELAEPDAATAAAAADSDAALREDEDGLPHVSIRLARLGLALDRPALVKDGLAAARAALAAIPDDAGDPYHWARHSLVVHMAEVLTDAGRGAEAVQLLSDTFARNRERDRRIAEEQQANGNNPGGGGGFDTTVGAQERPLLLRMMSVYHRTGRHADVREMLDAVPYWGDADLAAFLTETDTGFRPAGHLAAAALLAGDQPGAARKVVDAVLDAMPAYDPAYDLLLRTVNPSDARAAGELLARLDALAARDPLEDRPLVWKAELLRRRKQLDEAEQLVRRGIALDPADADQSEAGTRHRPHAVLAEVLSDKGDRPGADAARAVVDAIRTAEEGDRLADAGLLTRAVAKYRAAVERAPGRYDLHARLALRLDELGRGGEAERHYRTAFERMPDGVGRNGHVPTGCDTLLSSARAREIADSIFAAHVARDPTSPTAHFLLGLLREQQDRPADAVAPLREAARLDPDFVGAWQRLHDVGHLVPLPPAHADAAALNLIRLDPLGRGVRPVFRHVTDTRALWSAAAAAATMHVPAPTALYPLAASAREIERANVDAGGVGGGAAAGAQPMETENEPDRPTTPAQVVWSTEVMQAIRGLVVGE